MPLYPDRPAIIPDNAIAQAALELRKVYEQAIDGIEKGEVVIVDDEDISQKVIQRSLAEIATLDAVIARSASIARKITDRGASIHLSVVESVGSAGLKGTKQAQHQKEQDVVRPDDVMIPGVGEYKH